MSKRLLYTEDSPVSFKLGDTATKIKIQPFFTSEDVNVPVNLRSYRSIRLAIRNAHTYISSYPVSLFNDNVAVISSSQLEELPADQYFVELWCTDDNLHSDVFPSDEYLPLHISPNAMGELGETITKVSLDQAVKELNEKIDDRLKDAKGEPGLSAYQVWLQDGNKGTIHDFLNSLKGDKGEKGEPGIQGEPGLSAYDLWLKAGNAGSQTDFLNALKGEPGKNGKDGTNGDRGPQGEPGKSAYQEAVDNGFSGSLTDWLKSLKGEKGEPGIQGEPGTPGKQGEPGQPGQEGQPGEPGKPGKDGLSAYQLWQAQGNVGTVDDFLKSLKGKDGQDGAQGAPGKNGVDGQPGEPGKPGKDGLDGKNVSENLIATSVVFPDFFDGTPYNFDTYPDPRTTFTTDVFIGTDPTKKSVVDVPYGTFAGLYQTGYSDNWYAKVNITVNGYPTGKPINWSFLRFRPEITINHINAVDNDGKTYASISGYNDKLTEGAILTKSVSMNSGGEDACSALNQYVDFSKIVTQGVDYTDLRTGKSYNKSPLVTMAYVVDSEPFTLKQTGPQEYDLALERVSNIWGIQGDGVTVFIAGWYGNLPAISGSNGNWGTFCHASLNRVEAYQTNIGSFITPYENGSSDNSGVNVKTHGKQG